MKLTWSNLEPTIARIWKSLHWLQIQQRINFKLATLLHRSLHNAALQYIASLLHPYTPSRQLRSASLNLLYQPHVSITLASRGFRHTGPSPLEFHPHHLRSWKFLSQEKGEYGGEHGDGSRMNSRRCKCAYQNWDVYQKWHQVAWRSLPVKQMYLPRWK